MINVGRGTQAWAGFAVADSPLVHKDPQNFIVQKTFGLKQNVKWNPIPVLTPGMQEPVGYLFEGMHSVAGNVQTPLYPEQTMALLKSVFGGVAASCIMKAKVVITIDGSSSTMHLKVNDEPTISVNLTAYKDADTETLLADVNAASGSVVTATYVDDGDHALGIILTGSALFNAVADANGGSAVTVTTMSGYTHKLLGRDTVPNVPLAFTFYEDLSCMNLVGCYPTSFDLEIDKGNPVQLNMTMVGMHGFDQKGTAGSSVGQNAITFPVVLVAGVNDQIKLAVDGGTAVDVTIAADSYANAAALEDAINDAIAGTASLLDTYRRALAACYVNTASKFVIYSGSKGTTSSVAWTAGTNDASADLSKGTPVEAAGAATNVKPSESAIQPFITTRAILKLGGPNGVEIPGVEKVKISVNNGMGLLETIGFYFAHIPVINKRREVKVTFDMAFTDTSFLSKFLVNDTISLYMLLETGVAIGSTADKYKAEIFLNSCKILKTPLPNVSGQGYIKQTVEAQAFADPTYQDIELDVTNSQATV
jgi:hypothetical protein